MLQLACIALVLTLALGELVVLRQWLQRPDGFGMQQVAGVAAFRPTHPGRN